MLDMNEHMLSTVAQLRAFLDGTEEVRFEAPEERGGGRYAFVTEVVKRLRYRQLKRAEKGVVDALPGTDDRLLAPAAHSIGRTRRTGRGAEQTLYSAQ